MTAQILRALLVTLSLSAVGIAAGFCLGLAGAMAMHTRARPVVAGLVSIVRGTPFLVQLLVVHFGTPQLTGIFLSPYASSAIALSLNFAGYYVEIIRGCLAAVPAGVVEAARALGLAPWQAWLLLRIPLAIRISTPQLTSLAVSIVKGTTIVSLVALTDLARLGVRYSNMFGRPDLIFPVLLVFYVLLNFGLSLVIERRIGLRGGMRVSS